MQAFPAQAPRRWFTIVQTVETSDAEAFVRELAQCVPQHVDALMTIAQQGIEKEIQLGEMWGIERGRNEGKLEVARMVLTALQSRK